MPGEKTFPSYCPDDWDALEILPDADDPVPPDVAAPQLAVRLETVPLTHVAPATPTQVEPATHTGDSGPSPTVSPPAAEPWDPYYFEAIKKGRFPALLTRSSVFKVNGARTKASRYGKATCMGQYELSVKGPFLSLRDKSIWEIAMGLAAEEDVDGEEFPVTMSTFAKNMELEDDSATTMGSIFDALVRLSCTQIEYDAQWGMKGAGKLLASARMADGKCFISVDGGLAPMLTRDYRFELLPTRRRSMGSDLARWLHDFIGINDQHNDPFHLAWLRKLSGSSATPARFSQQLITALAELRALEVMGPCTKRLVVESFEVFKVGRDPDKWKVSIIKGEDTRPFTKPPSNKLPAVSKREQQEHKAAVRGRVAL